MADAQDNQQSSQGSKPQSGGGLFGPAFAVINLLVMLGGAYYIYSQTLGYQPPNARELELRRELASFRKDLQGEPVLMAMKTFTANLSGRPARTMRMEMSLEMLDAEGFEELYSVEGQARDAIGKIINAKSYADLQTVQGKLQLKNEIIAGVNRFLERGVVRNVYFTELVIQ